MESPKRGCDLRPCVVKRGVVQKKALRSCFLRFKRLPSGPGLAFRSLAFKKRGVLRLRF